MSAANKKSSSQTEIAPFAPARLTNPMRVIDCDEIEALELYQFEHQLEEEEQQPNGFIEIAKLSFWTSFGGSVGWFLGEFVAGIVKLLIIVATLIGAGAAVAALMLISHYFH